MIDRIVLALALLTAAFLSPMAEARVAVSHYGLDLRTLPADSRPTAARVEIDARGVGSLARDTWISIAINGMVIARHRASRGKVTVVDVPLQDRLLSTRNQIEIAASVRGCAKDCDAQLAAIRPVTPLRFRLGKPQAEVDDFSQLVTAYRAGIAVHAPGPREQALSAVVRAALAPAAPLDPSARASIHVGDSPPPGTAPMIRFDHGPVRLLREDGPVIFAPDALARMTVVQILRGRDRPLIWVRPGEGDLPSELDLSDGDIALFDAGGRAMAFSTLRDHRAVRIDYPGGYDPYGGERRMMIWRFGLLGFWLIASAFLLFVYRRLPRPQVSEAAA
ncbi:MAG: hypothetical protein J0H88_17715 [Sphingomonadales bacterium]|nr:hypothetical protein [Sphingomonadales bacterium]